MAKICYLHNVDFKCFKYISDNADDAAHDDWASNVARGKQLFIEKMQSLQMRPTVTI